MHAKYSDADVALQKWCFSLLGHELDIDNQIYVKSLANISIQTNPSTEIYILLLDLNAPVALVTRTCWILKPLPQS